VSSADRHRVRSSRPSVARQTGRPDDHQARSCNVLHLSRCTAVPKRSTISSHIDMHPGSCQTPPMVRARRICKLRHGRQQRQQQQQQSNGSNGRLRCGCWLAIHSTAQDTHCAVCAQRVGTFRGTDVQCNQQSICEQWACTVPRTATLNRACIIESRRSHLRRLNDPTAKNTTDNIGIDSVGGLVGAHSNHVDF